MEALIAILPGDGIGPEIMREGVRVLEAVAESAGHRFELREALIGGAAIDAAGDGFPTETRAIVKEADVTLLGAVGGPRWSAPNTPVRPEKGLLDLRAAMNVYANLRPVKTHPALYSASPLRPEYLIDVDIMVVRELTGGIYFGKKNRTADEATDVCTYHRSEIERVVRMAALFARERNGKVASIDKANVLETSRLWRSVTDEMFREEFSDLELETMFVDAAAMHLLTRPGDFDVLVTENMFGDILTDEASMLCGSLGMLPSASLNEDRRGLYEPIHGSAPDIAGQNIANPCATILSVAMMLRYTLALKEEAALIEQAVYAAIEAGYRTGDIAQADTRPVSTSTMGDQVIEQYRQLAKAI
ncbi:MAG: 3-isopropylmalate dehydrogenase [Gammaproteobacteria bacterium]|jgi:3-isopropylmalate dehydrogenase|nr:3-isopropylmalate dehydrogenase [Chromatiales bacterium]MDP6675556.1 3-isopropylmalate dehydrogenase [Gammaproteobacteria bacterium]